MNWITDNIQRISGSLTTLFGAIASLIATGQFEGLLEPSTIRWMGIVCSIGMTVLGTVTTASAINNRTKEKVAAAMQDAINAQPPTPKGDF